MNNPPGVDPKTGPPSVTLARLFLRRVVIQLLRLRVWFTKRGPGELWESNYFWAVIVGLFGAISSVLFRDALRYLEWVLFHSDAPLEYAVAGNLCALPGKEKRSARNGRSAFRLIIKEADLGMFMADELGRPL